MRKIFTVNMKELADFLNENKATDFKVIDKRANDGTDRVTIVIKTKK